MLVNKKEEWYIYEEASVPTPAKTARAKSTVHTNYALRAKCFVTVILVALFAGYFTVQSEAIIRSGYELVQIKAQLAKIDRENEALRLDIAKLKAPQRIQKIAINELGMVVPQNMYYITASANKPTAQAQPQQEKTVAGQVADYLKAGKAEAHPHN
jgi:cell division protein FtsL